MAVGGGGGPLIKAKKSLRPNQTLLHFLTMLTRNITRLFALEIHVKISHLCQILAQATLGFTLSNACLFHVGFVLPI